MGSRVKPFLAWDTETDPKTGELLLICNSNGLALVEPDIDTLLRHLVVIGNKYHNYLFNQKFDMSIILKTIAKHGDIIENISDYRDYKEIWYGNYSCQSLGGRFYIVSLYDHDSTTFDLWGKEIPIKRECVKSCWYDIAQYYKKGKSRMSLDHASYVYLKKRKLDFDASLIDADRFRNDLEYQTECIEYCKQDCRLTLGLVNYWYNQLIPVLGGSMKKFISAGFLAKRFIAQKWKINPISSDYINNFQNKYIMEQYRDELESTFYAGRFETTKKGYYPNKTFYLYDINSAYPHRIGQLCEFIDSAPIDTNDIVEGDFYKVFNVTIHDHGNDKYINPITLKTDHDVNYWPSIQTSKTVWLTEHDFELLDIFGCEYDLNRVLHFPYNPERKLFPYIQEMYEWRKKLKNEGNDMQLPIKLILNSHYGVTRERIPKFTISNDVTGYSRIIDGYERFLDKTVYDGRFYHPLVGSDITSYCRSQVIKEMVKHGDEKRLYMIATDSILTDIELDYLPISKKLGEWDKEIHKDVIILGNGMMLSDNKIAMRGYNIPYKRVDWTLSKEEQERQRIENHPYNYELCKSMIQAGKGMSKQLIPLEHTKKYGFDAVVTIREIEKEIRIVDEKRVWDEHTVQDLLNDQFDSEPIEV